MKKRNETNVAQGGRMIRRGWENVHLTTIPIKFVIDLARFAVQENLLEWDAVEEID